MVDPLLNSSECVTGRSRAHMSWPVLSGHSGQICSELRDTSRSIRHNSENGYYCIVLTRVPNYGSLVHMLRSRIRACNYILHDFSLLWTQVLIFFSIRPGEYLRTGPRIGLTNSRNWRSLFACREQRTGLDLMVEVLITSDTCQELPLPWIMSIYRLALRSNNARSTAAVLFTTRHP